MSLVPKKNDFVKPGINRKKTVRQDRYETQGVNVTLTIEGKKYPVFGTQWHPEKNTFEWTDREGIPHTPGAVAVAQYTANFFVQQARKSTHVYDFTQLMTKDVIWNYTPVYTYVQGSNFISKYFF